MDCTVAILCFRCLDSRDQCRLGVEQLSALLLTQDGHSCPSFSATGKNVRPNIGEIHFCRTSHGTVETTVLLYFGSLIAMPLPAAVDCRRGGVCIDSRLAARMAHAQWYSIYKVDLTL